MTEPRLRLLVCAIQSHPARALTAERSAARRRARAGSLAGQKSGLPARRRPHPSPPPLQLAPARTVVLGRCGAKRPPGGHNTQLIPQRHHYCYCRLRNIPNIVMVCLPDQSRQQATVWLLAGCRLASGLLPAAQAGSAGNQPNRWSLPASGWLPAPSCQGPAAPVPPARSRCRSSLPQESHSSSRPNLPAAGSRLPAASVTQIIANHAGRL